VCPGSTVASEAQALSRSTARRAWQTGHSPSTEALVVLRPVAVLILTGELLASSAEPEVIAAASAASGGAGRGSFWVFADRPAGCLRLTLGAAASVSFLGLDGTRRLAPQVGQLIVLPTCIGSHAICWSQEGQLNFISFIVRFSAGRSDRLGMERNPVAG